MRKLVATLVVTAAVVTSAALAATRPNSGSALLAIDKRAGFRNFLPTRMLSGFSYQSWSYTGGVLTIEFRSKAGLIVEWDVAPMGSGHACGTGSQKTFQLDGNKVWWAQLPEVQRAWRCVFAQDGLPLTITAASPSPASKVAPTGLGIIAASGKRY